MSKTHQLHEGAVSAMVSVLGSSNDDDGPLERTELDSHANMVVLCGHAYVYDRVNDNTCDVLPFDPALGKSSSVPIVDGALAYDCPRTNQTYILVFKNALHVPSMTHNLVPPFILREAGLKVKETPKIHVSDPDQNDHSISDPDSDLHITLQLHGIFLYFHTRTPTTDELSTCQQILMTPDTLTWDPYSPHFALNKESMVDHEGILVGQQFRKRHCPGIYEVSSFDAQKYDDAVDMACDEPSLFSEIDATTNSHSLATSEISSLAASLIQSCLCGQLQIPFSTVVSSIQSKCPLFTDTTDDETVCESIPLPIDNFSEVSAVVTKPSGVSPEYLSKIWRIKQEEAEQTLKQSNK